MDRSVKQPGQGWEEWKELIAVGTVGAVGEAAGLSLRLGEVLYGGPDQDISWNPLILGINLVTGDVVWTGSATAGAVTMVAGAAAGVAGSVWAWRATCRKCRALYRDRGRIRREAIDSQARYMAKGKELAGLTVKAVRAKAQQLGVQLRAEDAPGVLIGRAVADGQCLYGSYEDLHLDIWGPRQGKSTSRVIPAVLEAPGAVVATSNKRDVVDATRALRARDGRRVWVFDPQGVAGEAPTWYWDPLSWVRDGGRDAQMRATELAGHFAAGGEASSKDAFFDPEGEDLLAALFLAAAMAEKPITQVFRWVTNPDDKDPIKILDQHGYDLLAGGLSDQYYSPDKQRSGVFSTAKKMAACLKFASIAPWVTPPAAGEVDRTPFTVSDFVASRDTLFPLSQEGKGSAGPLLVALCHAIGKEGKSLASRSPGGRLPVPMTLVLDEAANIVKWADLPAQYSYFGSCGIVVMTILQSWSQGVRCWGQDGMQSMWSAANVKVLGSGLDERDFLEARAQIIGNHYEQATSLSKGRDSRSTTVSRTTEPTLTASDLAGLPRGRLVVFTSGHRPTLCQAVPWMERPYADEVRAALADIEYTPETPEPEVVRPQLRVVPLRSDEEEKSA